MLPLSVNLMGSGASLAARRNNTGLWYAYNTKTGGVLAYTFGPRNDETCRELLALLTPFCIGMVTSDDWGSYAREVPKEKHLTGKIFTQRIERNNRTLRTRIKRLARKTICFSRSVEIHEKSSAPSLKNTYSTDWKDWKYYPAKLIQCIPVIQDIVERLYHFSMV
ncbi:Transposase (plasmid) [Shigella dysenteriae WRSd3]|uniref:Transposase n=4 Tax=Enterobacteriaceae TaxID=543 RepID=A0A090N9H6_SHIDY|nr:Transposase [Shigella dysenteriae WRSd3]